jgi:hypothetical protein
MPKNATTYHQFAETDETPGGRYARLHPPIPASPKAYPKAAAWCGQDQLVEPPLGFSVEAIEPVGTVKEIEASLAEQMAPTALSAVVETEAQPRAKDNDE